MPHNPIFKIPEEDLGHVLTHTEEEWKNLRGNRIFITGGTGFFGKWLLAVIAAANERLNARIQTVVLSREPSAFIARHPEIKQRADIEWVTGDVRSFDFPPGDFPFVIHAATAASEKLNKESPREMFDTIVEGTRRTLEFAERANTQAFLLTSSGAVYGKQPPELSHIPETYMGGPNPTAPSSAYAEGKRVAEFLCATSKVPVKIARCFAFIGPHLPLDTHFAAGNFIRDAMFDKQITVRGDGRTIRSYLYVADLIIWLLKILTHSKTMRPYNVGSTDAIDIRGLANAVSNAQSSVPIVFLQQPSNEMPERYVPDTARAIQELNLPANITLTDALARHLAWCKLNT